MDFAKLTGLWENSQEAEREVGEPIVDQTLLNQVSGGASSGWICSVSGECNCSGCSCWPF